jgi:putative ABC transport system permease protein
MNMVAIKMLVGDRGKYIGIITGITFASLLITQQLSIFTGLMARTYGFITDTGQADIWVMDDKVKFIDDITPMQDTELYRVRSVEGVSWAVPLYKGMLRARLSNGNFQTCNVIGLDDSTLMGGPPKMIEGRLEDLRRSEGVIIDAVGAHGKLAKPSGDPNIPPEPVKVGDTLELNDHRAVVVGICEVSRTFQSQPMIYTTYSRATLFAPQERKLLSFILAGKSSVEDAESLCDRIEAQTGLMALSSGEFKQKTYDYFIENTGIPINFGIAVVLGFFVGTAIAGQTFFQFTHDNERYFGALKAMGATNFMLLKMILLQAMVVGVVGYGLGVGAASFIGYMSSGSELAFLMPPVLLLFTSVAVLVICLFSALISIIKVMRLEPAIVFKT